MSPLAIFCIGLLTAFLCTLFVVISAVELRKAGANADAQTGGSRSAE